MKITNYQKQQLKMYNIKFNDNTTFDEAKNLIEEKEKEIQEQKESWMKNNNLEVSNLFSYWLEDN